MPGRAVFFRVDYPADPGELARIGFFCAPSLDDHPQTTPQQEPEGDKWLWRCHNAGMKNHTDRRRFLGAALSGTLTGAALAHAASSSQGLLGAEASGCFGLLHDGATGDDGDDHRGPCVIASGNGPHTVRLAYDLLEQGIRPVEACVKGVKLVEDDPNDMSVGLGGLPNEDGVVELDSACMDGPLHKAGAVGAIRDIKNPASVALEVLRRTDHVMLVGEGAKRFALRVGFKAQDLTTEKSRRAWLRWRANLNKGDKWLDDDQTIDFDTPIKQSRRDTDETMSDEPISHVWYDTLGVAHTWGTIHCSAVNKQLDIGCCTTTSGLSWKLPGRVGDSPIIGAGLYCDNAVGSAGATGRGESVIQTVGSAWVVSAMENGMSPTKACFEACKRIVDRTRQKRLFDAQGKPRFNVTFYALRKDGAYGSACIRKGGNAVVCTEQGVKHFASMPLYE